MSFDRTPDRGRSAVSDTEAGLRRAALRFMTSHQARLLCAARRLGQDDGVALARAFHDRVADPRTPPAAWPIEALLAVLRRGAAGPDYQVPRMIQLLEALREAASGLAELRTEAEEAEV